MAGLIVWTLGQKLGIRIGDSVVEAQDQRQPGSLYQTSKSNLLSARTERRMTGPSKVPYPNMD